MTQPAQDPDEELFGALLDALARQLDIACAPEWRPAVLAHLRRHAELAALVGAFDLPEEVDAAPVFTP